MASAAIRLRVTEADLKSNELGLELAVVSNRLAEMLGSVIRTKIRGKAEL